MGEMIRTVSVDYATESILYNLMTINANNYMIFYSYIHDMTYL